MEFRGRLLITGNPEIWLTGHQQTQVGLAHVGVATARFRCARSVPELGSLALRGHLSPL
jgi:hypothetical protein